MERRARNEDRGGRWRPTGSRGAARLGRTGVYSMYSHGGVVRTKVQRWGNSLGLRIPRAFAEEAGVEAGAEVDLSIRDGDLVVKPARRVKYRLGELLRKITARNLHGEVDTGGPVGREAW